MIVEIRGIANWLIARCSYYLQYVTHLPWREGPENTSIVTPVINLLTEATKKKTPVWSDSVDPRHGPRLCFSRHHRPRTEC